MLVNLKKIFFSAFFDDLPNTFRFSTFFEISSDFLGLCFKQFYRIPHLKNRF